MRGILGRTDLREIPQGATAMKKETRRFRMSHKFLLLTAGTLLTAAVVIGQQTTATRSQATPAAPASAGAAAKAPAAAKPWVMPRTPDGQPDLQGYWTNATYAPLERAAGNANKQFFTKEEFDARVKAAALQDEQQ